VKIESIQHTTAHFVETDEHKTDDWYQYTRHSANNWSVRMGESDESEYDCKELEEAFQKELAKAWNPVLMKLGFESHAPGVYNKLNLWVFYEGGHMALNKNDTHIAVFQDPYEFETFINIMERRFE
jgi:hypothetical protein